jgi:hypothetical protein
MAKPPNVGTLIAAAKRIVKYFSKSAPTAVDRPSTLKVLTPEELNRIGQQAAEATKKMLEYWHGQGLR